MARNTEEFRVEVTADTKDAVKDLKAVDKLGHKIDGETYEAEAHVDNDQAEKALRQVQADAKKFENEMRQPVKLDLDAAGARRGLEDVGDAAGKSKSVLANMIGNTTQDLGSLGGVAGSTGVAIGQMGEYIADAAASGAGLASIATSFGSIVLPVAALSIAVPILAKAFGGMSTEQQVAEQTSKDLAAAFHELDSASEDLRGEAIGKNIKDMVNDMPKFTKHVKNLGISAQDLADVMMGEQSPAIDRVRDELHTLTTGLDAATKAEQAKVSQSGSALQMDAAAAQAEEDYAASLGITVDQLRDRIAVEKDTIDTIDGKIAGTQKARAEDDLARDVLDGLTRSTDAQKKSTKDLADAYDDVRDSIDLTKGSLFNIKDQFDKVTDTFLTGEAAQIRQRQQWEELKKSIDDTGSSLDDKKAKMVDFFESVSKTGGEPAVLQAIAELKKQVAPGSPLDVWLDQMANKINATFTDREMTIKANVVISPEDDRLLRGAKLNFGMAGTPYSRGGPYRVGEAGPETVWLPRGSRVDTAGRTMMADTRAGGGTVINYHITVNAPPLTNPAEVGGAVVNALRAYERRSGKGWRAA